MHVDAIDESCLIGGLQKIANRITVGLILAALIVDAAHAGADILRDLWYPGLAMILFLAAAVGGVLLVINIPQA